MACLEDCPRRKKTLPKNMQKEMKVIVVGGGWAGLAAAVNLSQQNVNVTLLESAKQLGGRARSIESNGWHIDNGQHLMLGAYREILGLLEILKIKERDVLRRKLLTLDMRSTNGDSVKLQVPNVAAPIHLPWALMRAKGLNLHERGTALRMCLRLARKNFQIDGDQPLEKWLQKHGQSRNLIKYLWEPLCLAALNTPIKNASTQVFVRVLHDSFAQEREDSDLLFFLPALNDFLPSHAQTYIKSQGGEVIRGARVTDLLIKGDTIKGVIADDKVFHSDHVILATPPWVTAKLLEPYATTKEISNKLEKLTYNPICTVYLQYPSETQLDSEMVGMVDSCGQWVFDRRLNNQPGLMSVVISGPGKHMEVSNESLAETIKEELAALNPSWPQATDWRIIREKRATFDCHANINQQRPTAKTPLNGLWIAGDFVDTGYPATLEGAVRSGVTCAKEIKHSSSYLI
jgi:squalene-associated FAD-dependent desaturase